MNDQQRAAMQIDSWERRLDIKYPDAVILTPAMIQEVMQAEIIDLREALAQPQKPDECANGCPERTTCDYCATQPQGDPVAFEQWYEANVEAMNIADFKPWMSEAWEAAIEATKEKAAKVCEEMYNLHEEDWDYCVGLVDCAAAIRSMK